MSKLDWFIILLFSISFNFWIVNTGSDFGPFNVIMKSISFCKGPRRRGCGTNNGTIINNTILIYDMDITEDVGEIEGKLVATLENKRSFKLQMKKLCDSAFWRPFVEQLISFKNCIIRKGKYHMEINGQEATDKYFGGSFIYGTYMFKSVYFNKNCTLGCSVMEIALVPKH